MHCEIACPKGVYDLSQILGTTKIELYMVMKTYLGKRSELVSKMVYLAFEEWYLEDIDIEELRCSSGVKHF